MAKKKKGDEQQQPRVSPYTDSPVTLYVGPERKTYYVPKHLLLQNPGRITASLSQWSSSVYLPDIDTSTGHVLVHYLYTGAYQTLDRVETSLVKVHAEFKNAFVVYKAAKTYEITGLQQLAMDELEQYGKAMTIFNVIEAIDENFSTLTGDTDWFQEYLIGKFSRAFQEDFTIFATSSFFDSISNADLYKFAVKCAVELYSNKISRLLCLEQREPIAVEEEPVAFEVTIGESDLLKDRGAIAGGGGDGGGGSDEKKEDDDWGHGWDAATTKKKKKGKKSKKEEEEEQKKRKEEGEEAERKKKEEEKEAERKKTEEDAAAAAAATNTANDLSWADPAPTNNEDDWGTFTAPAGKKKGKKGKTAEPAPAPPPAADPPTTFDTINLDDGAPKIDMKFGDICAATSGLSLSGCTSSWGSGTKGSASWGFDDTNKAADKKDDNPWGSTDKKKDSDSFADFNFDGYKNETKPPAEEKPAEEDDGWGFSFGSKAKTKKKKKGSGSLLEDSVPEPSPPPPEPEKPKEEDPWAFSFGAGTGTTTTKGKKKKKKGALIEPEPESVVEPPKPESVEEKKDDDWSFGIWGGKKKKKGKDAEPEPNVEDALVQEPDGVEEPKAEGEEEWGTPSWGKNKTKKNDGPVDFTEEAPTAPIQKPDEEDPWGRAQFGICKKTKKGKKGSALNSSLALTPPVEVNLLDDIELPLLKAIEAPPPEEEKKEEEDMWGFLSSKKKKKKGRKDEPADDGGKLSKTTSKDSALKAVDDLITLDELPNEEEKRPEPEPAPPPPKIPKNETPKQKLRLAKEKEEKAAAEKEAKKRKKEEKAQREKEAKEEAERLEREAQEAKEAEEAAEKARLDAEAEETARLEAEAAAEKERLEAKEAEKAKKEAESSSGWGSSIWGSSTKKKESSKQKKEHEAREKKVQKEREEQERAEKEEADRSDAERIESEAQEAREAEEAAERERIEAEEAEKARIEAEEVEKAKKEAEASSGWGASIWGSKKKETTKQRRKREKKGREEANAACSAEEAETACFAVETAAVETPAATAARPEPAKQSQMKNENFSGLVLELRKYIEADEVVCPDQAKHLLEERMWKNCRLCQGFLCQVANQIAFIIQPASEVEAGPVEKETHDLEAGRRLM